MKMIWKITISKGYPECCEDTCRNCRVLASYYFSATEDDVKALAASTKLHVEYQQISVQLEGHHLEQLLRELEEEHL